MPQTDAITYLHGTGTSSGGNVTSTSNVVGSGSQSGTTLTITTVTSGQFGVGQVVTGTGVLPNTYITALGSGASGTAGTYVVSTSTTISPATVFTMFPPTPGDAIGTATGYSNLELDFGAPNTGGAYPFLVQFPSLTEKGYTFAPEILGQGGSDFGIHVLVTGYVNNLTTLKFDVVTASTTAALVGNSPNPIASRTFTLAQLQVVGAHYYIPVSGNAVLEFLRVSMTLVGTAATAGTAVIYWAPTRWRRTVMPIVEALCLNDAFDSTACWYYEKGRTYEIDTESEIAHMKVRPMSSGKMNKDGEIVAATITRPSLPVFQFDRANPLGTAGASGLSDYTCKKCGANKDNLGRPFTLNSLGNHTRSAHSEVG